MQITLGAPAPSELATGAILRRSAGRLLAPSLADVVFVGCLLLCLFSGAVMISADGDPGRHLTVGGQILATRTIPSRDAFSHTLAGAPFVPYEWLAELLSAASFDAWGLAGPVLLHGSLIAFTFSLVYCHLRRRGHGALTAVAVTMACASVSTVHWLARPHVFTFAGTALFAFVLDGWRGAWLPRRALWALPPLMTVWTNAHGGFLVGAILLGVYGAVDAVTAAAGAGTTARAARRRLAQLVPAAAVTLAATLVNPAGPGLWTHVTGYFGKSLLVNLTQEYMAPSPHDHSVLPFYLLLGLLAAAMLVRRARPGLLELALTGAFAFFALYAGRNIPLFAIVAAPALAASVEDLDFSAVLGGRALAAWVGLGRWLAARSAAYARLDARSLGHAWPAAIVIALLAAAAGTPGAPESLGVRFDPARQPVAAVAAVRRAAPAGNVFNELVWGGYLLHELWPDYRVFIDGQTDHYGEPLTREYLTIRGAEPGWRELMQRYDVRWVILPPDAPLVRALVSDPAWRTVHTDRLATVLVQETSR